MLRNRSRAVTSKQALMADHSSQPSHTQNYNNKRTPISFFVSPRFKAFTKKGFSENDDLVSPTSVLDTKTFFSLTSPFSHTKKQAISPKVFPGNKRPWDKSPGSTKGIGLVLIDPFDDQKNNINGEKFSKPCNRKVVLGNKLRVQIPTLSSDQYDHDQSPKSPAEFGIKTRNSHISACGSANSCGQPKDISPRSITGWISVSDVEHSEDYTCVISHGPVPRTTHIFDNCIVESYCCLSDDHDHNNVYINKPKSCSENFLSFCHTCNKNLEQKIDIYIYRGEKAFCSRECRYQEMLLDEVGNAEF